MIWGTGLQQSFGVSTAAPDIRVQTQPTLTGNAGNDRDGLGVRVRHYCLCLGTPAIESLAHRLRHLRRTKYRFGSIRAAYKALPQLPKYASAALSSG